MTDRQKGWLGAFVGAVCAVAVLAATSAKADINVSGSAYADYWYLSSDSARKNALSGFTPEASLKIEVDMHESLSLSARVCFGCHGLEVDRAHIDFTPTPAFNIQAGRIGVPFGEMSIRYDPTSHRSVSKPLIYEMGRMAYYGRNAFNLGVVPQPFVDTGFVLYGQVWMGENVQLWYGAYAVAGMKGENDFDYISMRTPYYVDNNLQPAGGGRLVLTFSSSTPGAVFKDFSLGLSGMHGRYDSQRQRKYTAFGADASLRVGPLTLRGEAAWIRFDIDPTVPGYRYQIIDPFVEKGGFFAEAEHPLSRWLVILYRFDMLRRAGVPLPDSNPLLSPDSRIYRYTQSVQFLLADSVYAKAAYEYWWLNDFPSFHSIHFGVGGSF
ncbi:MAG: hypothetical protein ACT4TC_04190 [Myxococcaceae bacterium]